MRYDLTKDNYENYIKRVNLTPYRDEFKKNKQLSDKSLSEILGRKPHLSSDYSDLDSRDMAVEEFHLWRQCEELIYSILRQTA